ncbi:MAG: right-handed parallel beta-helix repeat-containing protein [Myxococcota bacterium]
MIEIRTRRFPLAHLTGLVVVAGTSFAPTAARAATTEIGPADDLYAALSALSPGDELILQGGDYVLGPKLIISLVGTEMAPIVIRSKDGEVAHLTRNDASQNTINIEDAAHVALYGIEVSKGSHGIRIRNSSFITIEDCEVHDTNDVAISANFSGSVYEGLRFVGNHIHHTNGTGEGFYLGCNNDACRMHHSLVAENYIHDTNGPGVTQGDGIEIKEGSYDNVVRDNVIHDTKYPCILTYSVVGNGGPNVVEGNVMWGCGDHGIQAAADAVIRNNIILGAAQDGLRSQPHQSGVPGDLVIVHNTILNSGNAIRINGAAGPITLANNALFSQSGHALRLAGNTSQIVVAGNVGEGAVQNAPSGIETTAQVGTAFVSATYGGGVPNDVFPAPAGGLAGAGDAAYVTDVDFNGTPRLGVADAGAYAFDAMGNPGWALDGDFKDLPLPGGEGGGDPGEGGADPGVGGSGGDGAPGGDPSQGGDGRGRTVDADPASADASDADGGCRVAAGRVGADPDRGPAGAAVVLGLFGVLLGRRRRAVGA